MSTVSTQVQSLIDALSDGPIVLGMGNPLLDISSPVKQEFFDRYGVKPNNAILAEEKHMPMYEELSNLSTVQYIGGGSTLNTIRVCQWMLQTPGATGYIGCIAKDKFGDKLSECAKNDGVTCEWMYSDKNPTGTCAVAIMDKERSLIANLAAANDFHSNFMSTEKVQSMLKSAAIAYSAGFWVTVTPESMEIVGKHALENNKFYGLNFSAPFIVEFFKDKLAPVMAYATHIFTNEDEAAAFAKANNIQYKNMEDLALSIWKIPSKRDNRSIIITQGKNPVVVAKDGKVNMYEVKAIAADKIVDLNGAGDAFVGGYLSQLALNKDEKTCVQAGNYCASVIIQTSGTKLSGNPTFTA